MAGLLLSSAAQNGQVLAQDVEVEDMDFDPSQQRRELWDFFDFFSLRKSNPRGPVRSGLTSQ